MEYRRALIGELISEALAVAIIILIGDGAAAMITLYDPSPYAQAYWGVCIAWGLGVTIAIYVTGAVSGTHANPAVTLALAFFRGFPKRKILGSLFPADASIHREPIRMLHFCGQELLLAKNPIVVLHVNSYQN